MEITLFAFIKKHVLLVIDIFLIIPNLGPVEEIAEIQAKAMGLN